MSDPRLEQLAQVAIVLIRDAEVVEDELAHGLDESTRRGYCALGVIADTAHDLGPRVADVLGV